MTTKQEAQFQNIAVSSHEHIMRFEVDDRIVARKSEVRIKKDRDGNEIAKRDPRTGEFVPVTQGGNDITASAYFAPFEHGGRKYVASITVMPSNK